MRKYSPWQHEEWVVDVSGNVRTLTMTVNPTPVLNIQDLINNQIDAMKHDWMILSEKLIAMQNGEVHLALVVDKKFSMTCGWITCEKPDESLVYVPQFILEADADDVKGLDRLNANHLAEFTKFQLTPRLDKPVFMEKVTVEGMYPFTLYATQNTDKDLRYGWVAFVQEEEQVVPQIFTPRLPNLFGDGKICLGKFPDAQEDSLFPWWDAARYNLSHAAWGRDLLPLLPAVLQSWQFARTGGPETALVWQCPYIRDQATWEGIDVMTMGDGARPLPIFMGQTLSLPAFIKPLDFMKGLKLCLSQ